jgi:hypothetical protein
MTTADYVRKSYRYLRLGLIAAALMILVSLTLEWFDVERACFQTSVSGYYYTPVRAVFVSSLVTIGVALIAIKGHEVEDLLLNIAGMLAPLVTFIPTRNVGLGCWSSPPPALPLTDADPPVLADWVVANIENNLHTLIYVGLGAVVLSAILLAATDARGVAALGRFDQGDKASRRGVAVTAILIAVVWVSWDSGWEWFRAQLHNGAAIFMFVFLAAASWVNAYRKSRRRIKSEHPDQPDDYVNRQFRSTRAYYTWYLLIPWLMVGATVGVVVAKLVVRDWQHHVLVLEMAEIVLFAMYWIVQTREHWDDPVPNS